MTDLARSGFSSRRQMIAYWVTTALVVMEVALGGTWDILRVPQVRELIERLGYPSYLLVILGIWKLLGAVALAIPRFPRLKEWAYAGVVFDLTGAIASLWGLRADGCGHDGISDRDGGRCNWVRWRSALHPGQYVSLSGGT
jgi:uncharacterized membrane protein YphA (DoxX/SURF4 family)